MCVWFKHKPLGLDHHLAVVVEGGIVGDCSSCVLECVVCIFAHPIAGQTNQTYSQHTRHPGHNLTSTQTAHMAPHWQTVSSARNVQTHNGQIHSMYAVTCVDKHTNKPKGSKPAPSIPSCHSLCRSVSHPHLQSGVRVRSEHTLAGRCGRAVRAGGTDNLRNCAA